MFKPRIIMASSKIVLYTSKTLKNGEHPIMIRLIIDRKIKYISLGFSTNPIYWDNNEKSLLKGYNNFKKANYLIHKKKSEIDGIILDFENEGKSYTVDDIEKKFLNFIEKISVFKYCQEIIDRLVKTNRIGDATVKKDLLRSLKKFTNNKDIAFSELNYSFLLKYEEDFLHRGVTENSISVYMRTLRAIVNLAIKEGHCKEDDYAFKTYKISKLNNQTKKRAISKEEMLRIINFDAEVGSSSWHSKNYFVFSFYNIGMNFRDLAQLKWSNILYNRIMYKRSKTGKNFDIKIHQRTQELLDLYSKGNEHSEDYIFPILNPEIHKTPQSKVDRIKKINKRVNKDLKEIATSVGIQATHSITHYVARHSWANIQKQNGVGTSIISESMGHDSEKTTSIYLQSFMNEVLDEANENLI
jgi:integrase